MTPSRDITSLEPTDARATLPRKEDREDILRMEFKCFLHAVILIPCQVIKEGRRILLRLIGYRQSVRLLFTNLSANAIPNSG